MSLESLKREKAAVEERIRTQRRRQKENEEKLENLKKDLEKLEKELKDYGYLLESIGKMTSCLTSAGNSAASAYTNVAAISDTPGNQKNKSSIETIIGKINTIKKAYIGYENIANDDIKVIKKEIKLKEEEIKKVKAFIEEIKKAKEKNKGYLEVLKEAIRNYK